MRYLITITTTDQQHHSTFVDETVDKQGLLFGIQNHLNWILESLDEYEKVLSVTIKEQK